MGLSIKKLFWCHVLHYKALLRRGRARCTRIERTLAERVADVSGALGRHVPHTRQILRKLIPGRILCTPFNDVRGRGYALSAVGSYEGLLSGKLTVKHGGGEGGI